MAPKFTNKSSKVIFSDLVVLVNNNLCLEELKIWAICYDYFMYKPEYPDPNSHCYHIVNLNKKGATLLVQDFMNDPSCTHFPPNRY